MDMLFQINPQLDIPIYQQLVDQIRSAVRRGQLTADEKLPTVQELADRLSIAKGTIKRAYDELEREGVLEKVQGRGTFVRRLPQQHSRKDRALAAIDEMLDKLDALGLSSGEVSIFLELKLRQRAQQEAKIRIALVECNTENLSRMAEQLRTLPGVELCTYLLSTVETYPYRLEENIDLIVTTAAHADHLEELLGEHKKVIRVALRLESQCMLELLRLSADQRVGILCSSLRFGQLLARTCRQFSEVRRVDEPHNFTEGVAEYLADKDVLLVAGDYQKYCDRTALAAITGFSGTVLKVHYELDAGSFLYLQEKVKRMLESKSR